MGRGGEEPVHKFISGTGGEDRKSGIRRCTRRNEAGVLLFLPASYDFVELVHGLGACPVEMILKMRWGVFLNQVLCIDLKAHPSGALFRKESPVGENVGKLHGKKRKGYLRNRSGRRCRGIDRRGSRPKKNMV